MASVTPAEAEVFLSGAVQRIRRITLILGAAGSVAALLLSGWRNSLGCVIGTLVGFVNLVWLHRGSVMVMDRLINPAGHAPGKLRMMSSFVGRYAFVIVTAYAILKGFTGMLLGFVVALFFPILAAMAEGVYESCVNIKVDEPRDEANIP